MATQARGGIFISYRRDDSGGRAGRIFDRVSLTYGRDRVFMDVDSIRPGVDFADYIDEALEGCTVLLAVIGPNWLDARNPDGTERLGDPHDFVRLEVATALRRGITVIPVLVDDAPVPETRRLPEDLQGLTRRAALRVDDERWGYDSERLVQALEEPLGEVPEKDSPRSRRVAPFVVTAVFLLVIGVGGGVFWLTSTNDSPPPSAADLTGASVEGQWAVDLTVRDIQGIHAFTSDNMLWNFPGIPETGMTSSDTWTLGPCVGDPCTVTWAGVEALNRFTSLTKEGATYRGRGEGKAKCIAGPAPVDRDLTLRVTGASGSDATAMVGTLVVGWTCQDVDFNATVDLVLSRTGS
jgi:TIR domain